MKPINLIITHERRTSVFLSRMVRLASNNAAIVSLRIILEMTNAKTNRYALFQIQIIMGCYYKKILLDKESYRGALREIVE